jgi:hypothetical protein
MAEKRKRPTRAQLDERLRNALNGIPAIGEASEPDAANGSAPAEPHSWSRTVSGRVEGSGIAS